MTPSSTTLAAVARQIITGTRTALPGQLSPERARRGGLIHPGHGDLHTKNPGDRPLNMRAQRRGRRMHLQHATNGHLTSPAADEMRLPQRSRRPRGRSVSVPGCVPQHSATHCALLPLRAPAPPRPRRVSRTDLLASRTGRGVIEA